MRQRDTIPFPRTGDRVLHAVAVLALFAGVLTVRAETLHGQIPQANVGQTSATVPFTFVVPLELTTLHRDVKRIAVECRVGARGEFASATGSGMDDSTLVAYGLTVLDAGTVIDTSGSFRGDVTVRAFTRGTTDPIYGTGYECSLYLSNRSTGGISSDGILDYCSADAHGTCAYYFRRPGVASPWSLRDSTVVGQKTDAIGRIPPQ